MEEDPAIQAAKILLTLRKRKLLLWPEWVQKDSAPAPPVQKDSAPASASAAEVEFSWPLQWWPKRPRTPGRRRGDWRKALPIPELGMVCAGAASASAGSAACSSGEERERWRERRPVRDELTARLPASPAYLGSSPSTSADRKARPRHAVGKAPPAVAVPKEHMKVSSPETPLDFAAAGSGASSSGDDGSRPPSKRRADGALGSGGAASSSDEGCSSPDKRPRLDAGDGDKMAISVSRSPLSVSSPFFFSPAFSFLVLLVSRLFVEIRGFLCAN